MAEFIPLDDSVVTDDERELFAAAMNAFDDGADSSLSVMSASAILNSFGERKIGLDEMANSSAGYVRDIARMNGWEDYAVEKEPAKSGLEKELPGQMQFDFGGVDEKGIDMNAEFTDVKVDVEDVGEKVASDKFAQKSEYMQYFSNLASSLRVLGHSQRIHDDERGEDFAKAVDAFQDAFNDVFKNEDGGYEF